MILTLAIILDLAIILRPVTTNTPISVGLLYFRLFKCISPFKPSEYRHGAGEVPSVSFHVIICTSPWEHTVNINENLEFKRSCYKYIQNAKAKRFCTFHHIWQTFCSRNQWQQLQVLLPSAFALPHDALNRAHSISLCDKAKVFPAGVEK